MMAPRSIPEAIYQRVFSRLLVFTILLEDAEVDSRFLGVEESSSVLGITGAGCGIAGLVAQRPRRIDAVDQNHHHLALTALKVEAARSLAPYDAFYDLFGHGVHPNPGAPVGRLVEPLPAWIQRYWSAHHGMFRRGLYRHGLFSRLFAVLRRQTGTNAAWLRSRMGEPVDVRRAEIDRRFAPVLTKLRNALVVRSPAFLLAHGINFVQRERNLKAEGTRDMVDVVLRFMKRIAETDVERNWIIWHATVGDFNHEHPEAVPPFLRRKNHERSFGAATQVVYHHRDILEVLRAAESETWSHFLLCDALDWMPDVLHKPLLLEILRTAHDGGVLLSRSVEASSLVSRQGLERHFQPMADATAEATATDRSCLYRHVGLYRIVR